MKNLLQLVVWHIEDHALGYLCALLICALCALCLGAWAARRRQRNILRRLLGGAFSRTRSYVNTGSGIALDEALTRFAISRGRKGAICTFADITEMKFNPSGAVEELVLETTHTDIPRLSLSGIVGSERLEDIHGLLMAMQKKSAPLQTRADSKKSDDVTLADAITKLTTAVTVLTKVMIDRLPCPDNQSGSKQARDAPVAYPDRDRAAFPDPSSRRLPSPP